MSISKVETFSTRLWAPRQRVAAWNQVMRDTFASAAVARPREAQSFSGEIARLRVGNLQFVEYRSESASVTQHGGSPDAASRQLFILQLMIEGQGVKRQCGRQARLTPGDIVICDGHGSKHYESIFDGAHRQLSIGIPKDLLRRYVPAPEQVLAVRMAGDRGVSSLVSATLRDFWRRCCAGEAMQGMQIEHALLAMVGAAYADTQAEQTLRSVNRSRVLAYIESHLRDPDLDPTKIANAVGMTTRNLHYVFENEQDETVGRYILRRRLEEAAYAIIHAPANVKLTALAVDFGFGSATHFGRAFREKFGVTPSEYRLRRPSIATT